MATFNYDEQVEQEEKGIHRRGNKVFRSVKDIYGPVKLALVYVALCTSEEAAKAAARLLAL